MRTGKTLYFDCAMGAAGDMLLGALFALAPAQDAFLQAFAALGRSTSMVITTITTTIGAYRMWKRFWRGCRSLLGWRSRPGRSMAALRRRRPRPMGCRCGRYIFTRSARWTP